jgi:hypothetical protein
MDGDGPTLFRPMRWLIEPLHERFSLWFSYLWVIPIV